MFRFYLRKAEGKQVLSPPFYSEVLFLKVNKYRFFHFLSVSLRFSFTGEKELIKVLLPAFLYFDYVLFTGEKNTGASALIDLDEVLCSRGAETQVLRHYRKANNIQLLPLSFTFLGF